MAVNQFMDLTRDEFKATYLNGLQTNNTMPKAVATIPPSTTTPNSTAVADIDWTKSGVTSVKDQGQCGSCWAFAAIAAAESMVLIKSKVKLDLSEQQLLDCAYTTILFVNKGCSGGFPSSALKYINAYGVSTEA